MTLTWDDPLPAGTQINWSLESNDWRQDLNDSGGGVADGENLSYTFQISNASIEVCNFEVMLLVGGKFDSYEFSGRDWSNDHCKDGKIINWDENPIVGSISNTGLVTIESPVNLTGARFDASWDTEEWDDDESMLSGIGQVFLGCMLPVVVVVGFIAGVARFYTLGYTSTGTGMLIGIFPAGMVYTFMMIVGSIMFWGF